MQKTFNFKALERQVNAGDKLARYFLFGGPGSWWPEGIILAVCGARWPYRTFAIDEDMANEDDDEFYDFDAAYDVATGENAADLFAAELAAAERTSRCDQADAK